MERQLSHQFCFKMFLAIFLHIYSSIGILRSLIQHVNIFLAFGLEFLINHYITFEVVYYFIVFPTRIILL